MKSIFIFLIFSTLFTFPAWPMGQSAPSGVSVLLVPAQPNLVQIGRDVAGMGEALMMSYAPSAAPESPFLHLWDGTQWLPVSGERFRSGSFLLADVNQVLVVGPENARTAHLIETSLGWCPEVLHLTTQEVTPLINQLGKIFSFSRGDWEWIASRYQLELTDLTAEFPRNSWYETHRPEDVPKTPPPWKRSGSAEAVPPPSTSLAPMAVETNDMESEPVSGIGE
jgi:hypothetical protein